MIIVIVTILAVTLIWGVFENIIQGMIHLLASVGDRFLLLLDQLHLQLSQGEATTLEGKKTWEQKKCEGSDISDW